MSPSTKQVGFPNQEEGTIFPQGNVTIPNSCLQEKKHTLDIEYSQVYYDPKGGEEDLDGISLILRSVPIDISVRKKGDKASMNDRILIQKDSTVEFAIHPDFFDKEADPQIDDFIKWEYKVDK